MNKWHILNKYKYSSSNGNPDELIRHLLSNRNITGEKQINAFINPDLKSISAEKLKISEKQLIKAEKRITKAIKSGESVVVYTDYDVDGIFSGAILWETLFDLGARVMPFVPDRIEDGYGLSVSGIDKIRKKYNPGLIVTVDHGISKAEEITYARKLGIDVIVIDHHTRPDKKPECLALIHSVKLAAVGVTWVFVEYLYKKIKKKKSRKKPEDILTDFLDLVALGTVADLVPLVNENRTLVKKGLEIINRTDRIGLNSLINLSGLKKGSLDSYHLGYILAPKINAAGRIKNAIDSLRLICTKDRERADRLAGELVNINSDRREMTKAGLDRANVEMEKLQKESSLKVNGKLIFIAHIGFHQGIIGLIAGKLVETYSKPAVVISVGRIYCKASARSVEGVNIVELLRRASDLLVDIGGHPMAAGFTVHKDNLDKLRKKLNLLSEEIPDQKLASVMKADLELDISEADKSLLDKLKVLAPFGKGNPEPLFVGYNNLILDYSYVGRDQKHIKLILASSRNPEIRLSAIGFNLAGLLPGIQFGQKIDIIYKPALDNWNNHSRLILKISDARLSPRFKGNN